MDTPFWGFGTALELARNGIERLRRGGFTGRSHGHGVRVHFGLLACLHIGQIGQRIERGAIGTPPFMNVSKSFLNSEAVA